MRRRGLLARVGAVAAAGLAGCTGSESGSGERTATDTPTRTDTETPMTPTLGDATIAVESTDCGQQRNGASVTFDDPVVVTGVVWAPNPGWTAVLRDVGYDPDADELTVTVGTSERETTGAVVQCIAEIEYRATIPVAGGGPGAVTVVHETDEGTTTVTTARRE